MQFRNRTEVVTVRDTITLRAAPPTPPYPKEPLVHDHLLREARRHRVRGGRRNIAAGKREHGRERSKTARGVKTLGSAKGELREFLDVDRLGAASKSRSFGTSLRHRSSALGYLVPMASMFAKAYVAANRQVIPTL